MGIEGAVVAASGVLGLLVGSFLNVVIVRLPRNESVVRPRSHCGSCGKTIAWYDNLPVLSYLLLGGKCRHCRAKFSPRYMLVEILTGALFAALAWRIVTDPDGGVNGPALARLGVYLYLTAALIASTFVDLEHQIIPDEISISGCVLAPILSLLVPSLHPEGHGTALGAFQWSLVGGIVGAGGVWLVGVLGKLAFRKDAMGLGDVKLMGMIGGLLGWKGVALTFLIGCVSGSVIGLLLLAITKNRYLPFAPYLSLGAMVVVFYGRELWDFITEVYPRWVQQLLGK